ncbi:MAG: PEGA domain-containing protein, partial [Alistipes sp.]|nr:PEGA domain-containing protein [Alistipes sp.]
MKRLLAILTLLSITLTATAQIENSIVIDSSSFRAVQTDALTGVNIDPIGQDRSRRPCARLKIFFHRMTREQMELFEPIFPSGTINYTKCKVAEGNTVLILEFTAKPRVKFYLRHPTFGTSNEVEFDFEGDKEYQLEASLNQTYSIVVSSNVANADVYLDGVFKGKTDSSNSLTIKDVMIGGHRLKLTYGNVSAEQTIDVNDSSILFRQNVNTAASEPQFVVFTVEPKSAGVIINNQHYTLTDGAMSIVLDGGSYSYTVTAAGYHSTSGTFTVAGNKVTKDIRLVADAASVTLT